MKMAVSCLIQGDNVESSNTTDQNEVVEIIAKPSVSLLKLIGSNILAFGLELCSSAGFTYISPILLKNGFSDKSLAFIMGIGPFISLILVPIIGRWSDRCQNRFGRRRPFMFVLGILTVISLLIIPYSSEIFSCNSIISPCYGLATGVILFDFSSQALMNPCKALIPDIFHSRSDQNSGFTVYSCMLSLGGCVGYFITSLNWTTTFLGIYFGGQEKAIFTILSVFLLILLIINISVAQEKPFDGTFYKSNAILDKNSNGISSEKEICIVFNSSQLPKVQISFKPNLGVINESTDEASTFFFPEKSLLLRSKFQAFLYRTELRIKNFFQYVYEEYFVMPPVLLNLFIASLFGWMGVMCHDMYYTDFVGQVIYKGRPHAEKESFAITLYDEGIRMGSWGLLLHCLSSVLYAALFQKCLISRYGTYRVYMQGILIFSMSMLGTAMTKSLLFANIFSAASGIGYAVLTTVPYSLITEYYDKKEIYYQSSNIRGVGKDMAVLDVAYFLSQIIPSLILGSLVDYTKSSTSYMGLAAVCGAAASYFAYFVTFPS
ncbi:solute carrier family 45 member 3 [Parasteatoda tepidariorum]|nr:solute carrier family 45 member 3 [Parasteatoda tepidariorum]